MNPVFFNPVTASRITTSNISKSPQIRFLIVWSSIYYFPVHQPAVTNSLHLQSAYAPHLQHLQSEAHLESSQTSVMGPFFSKIFNVLMPLFIFAEELHRGCLTGFLSYYSSKVWGKKLSTTGATQSNLGLPLPPNSTDLHQKQNKMKSWADPASLFLWVTPGTKTIKSWNNPGDISLSWNCASVLKFHSYHPK